MESLAYILLMLAGATADPTASAEQHQRRTSNCEPFTRHMAYAPEVAPDARRPDARTPPPRGQERPGRLIPCFRLVNG